MIGYVRRHVDVGGRASVSLRDRACIVGVGATSYCRAPGSGMSQLAIQLHGNGVTYLDPAEAKKAVQTYERSWESWKARLPR